MNKLGTKDLKKDDFCNALTGTQNKYRVKKREDQQKKGKASEVKKDKPR